MGIAVHIVQIRGPFISEPCANPALRAYIDTGSICGHTYKAIVELFWLYVKYLMYDLQLQEAQYGITSYISFISCFY